MTTTNDRPGPLTSAATGRIAGGILLLSALLTIVAMAHHPTGLDADGAAHGMTLGGFIHAAMIVLLAATLWGLTVFSVRQTLGGWMLAGLVAYGIGFVANVFAGTINGFIVPAVAARVDHAASADLFVLLWESNQVAANLGVYATSAAFLIWSARLLLRKSAQDLVVGGLGLLAALGPGAALFTGAMTLNVAGAMIAYGVHAAWTGLVGLQMLRRSL